MLKAKKILRDLKHQLKGTKTIFGYYDSENRKESKNLEMSELDLVRALAQYEIDFRKLYGVDYDDNEEGNYKLLDFNYGTADNSYNWSSQLVFDFNQVKVVDKYGEDHIYIAFRVHRYGDVRGNYTDTMILDMSMDLFLEECTEASRVYTTVTIKGRDYHITSDCFREGCLFDIYSSDADIDDYDVMLDIDNLRNKKDIKKAVKEYLVTR